MAVFHFWKKKQSCVGWISLEKNLVRNILALPWLLPIAEVDCVFHKWKAWLITKKATIDCNFKHFAQWYDRAKRNLYREILSAKALKLSKVLYCAFQQQDYHCRLMFFYQRLHLLKHSSDTPIFLTCLSLKIHRVKIGSLCFVCSSEGCAGRKRPRKLHR